jgi:hypothetical protein
VDEPLIADRRADVRLPCTSALGIRVVLRPGYVVTVLDISAGGAQIQGPRPLRPGAQVQLRLASPTRGLSLAAHVVRCTVWALDPQVGVVYRGAVQFHERCDWFQETRASRRGAADGTTAAIS